MGGSPSKSIESTSKLRTIESKNKNKLITAIHSSSSKLKSSFKRRSAPKDHTKPFRELITNWPLDDLLTLLSEFNADEYLLNLKTASENSRKQVSSFRDDFNKSREFSSDFSIHYKDDVINVHKDFIATRCKKLDYSSENNYFEVNSEEFSQEELRQFIDYLYTEKWENSEELLDKLKKELGCSKCLIEDCQEMMKQDLCKGDLHINVVENANKNDKKKSDFSICCSSIIASCRSSLINSLVSKRNDSSSKEKSIHFDETIFPQSFALVFVNFLYTDILDLSLIPSYEITISSLSQARAIVSGKSPDIQLHRALQIMQVAKFFGVEKMVQCCEDVVVKHLTHDNCVAVLQWARDGGSKYIYTHALRLIENDFSKIASTSSLFELTNDELQDISQSHFVQTTELELLESCIKWGEHDLLRKLEEREPNVVADTCHSISRRGLKRSELSGEEIQDILKPLTVHIRKDYALPPFHQTLTEAYNRGILERAPLREDLIVCPSTSEINPDVHWLKPNEKSAGPRYYKPYHETLRKYCQQVKSQGNIEDESIKSKNDIHQKLKFKNKYPEILEESSFIQAKETIENILEKEKLITLPRRFHKDFALKLIVRKVLTEMDISEECFECKFINEYENEEENDIDDEEEEEEDGINEIEKSLGSSCPSIVPDLLPHFELN